MHAKAAASPGHTRRSFLQCATRACTIAALAPIILSGAERSKRRPAASDRINVGLIGAGNRGLDVMRGFLDQPDCQVRVICDLNSMRADNAAQLVNQKYGNKDCRVSHDFREAAQLDDIDAFIIATPDHWHVLTALEAVNAGKDVYVEKPLALSLQESQALRTAVHRRKAVFQFGTQQRSGRMFRFAAELARNQILGKLHTINVWAPGSSPGGSITPAAPPEGMDFDFWLGPAQRRAYTQDLCSYDDSLKTWWFVSDFSLGFLTGWGIHPMDIALWGASDLMQGSVTVSGRGNFRPAEGICDTATIWDVEYAFSSGLKVKFIGTPNGSNRRKDTGEPFLFQDQWARRYRRIESHGTAFEGSNGWAHVDRTGINLEKEELIEVKEEDLKIQLPRASRHDRNFLDCVKSRRETVAPIDSAVRADLLCHLAQASMRLGRKVHFDFRTERFTRDDSANALLKARMSRPWKL